MALTDKIKLAGSNLQQGAKTSAHKTFQVILRALSGFFIGFVIALIFQEIIGFGHLMLSFVTLVLMGIIYKALSRRSVLQIIIFDIICVLIGMLLKMYILVASK